MQHLKSFFRNPGQYLAGIYFTLFKKVFTRNGITIHIPFHMTDIPFRGRFVQNKYEKEEATHLARYLEPQDKVLELGSCLGYVSCLTNKLLHNKEEHVVVEANPKLIPWIQKNKLENNCHFKIEHCIISPEKKNEFYIHELIVGGSTRRKTMHKIEVKGTTFSELEEKYATDFDTLIMDIEGGELDLLRNHNKEISKFRKIFYEVHPFANILTREEALECETILTGMGFQLVLRDGNFQVWKKP
ncbi:MAG: FkbM family methyltransferase [Eudoraea sp.]|nr:FkbM family methyltransferase [Eudoraea sp.]